MERTGSSVPFSCGSADGPAAPGRRGDERRDRSGSRAAASTFAAPSLPAAAALAWNPSLPGAKSEDTVLVMPDGGLEVVTLDPRWPATAVSGRSRPAVWVRWFLLHTDE